MRVLLTVRLLNAAAPKDGRRTFIEDAQQPGLVFCVTRTTRVWYLVVWRRRKKVRVLLGYYQVPGEPPPMRRKDAPLLGLREARDAAARELQRSDRGVGTAASRGAGTVAQLLERHIAAKAVLSPRTGRPARPETLRRWRRYLDAYILGTPLPEGARKDKRWPERVAAPFAHLPAADLTRAQTREWLIPITARAPVVALNLTKMLKTAWAWALSPMELLAWNDLASLEAPTATPVNERFLDPRECGALWRALHETRDRTQMSEAILLLMLTGVRKRMVLEMRVEQMEGLDSERAAQWTIAPEGTKSHRMHLVPLVGAALEIVRRRVAAATAAGRSHLFPADPARLRVREGNDLPMSWSTEGMYIIRKRMAELYGKTVAPWRPHSLRHTMRTHMEDELDISTKVAKLLLMHARKGRERVYNQGLLLDRRRVALTRWESWLRVQAGETKVADVVSIESGRR